MWHSTPENRTEPRVVHQRVDEHQPPGLGRGHGDHQRVEQAVPVVPDPVALEGGHRSGQYGEGEKPGQIGVRRGGRAQQHHRLADAQQQGPRSEQPPRTAAAMA